MSIKQHRFWALLVPLVFIVKSLSALPSQGHTSALEATPETYRLLGLLSEAFRTMRAESLPPVSDQVLIEGAIEGMAQAIGERASLLKTPDYEKLKTQVKGSFAGVGVEVQAKGNKGARTYHVERVLPGGPAARAGVKPGDDILKIDDDDVSSLSLLEVVRLLKGTPGSVVSVQLARPAGGIFTKKIIRGKVDLQNVLVKEMEGVLYIKIISFQDQHIAKDVKAAIVTYKNKINSPLEGIIIDLRGNGGGLLDQAVEVANLFLERGDITLLKGRRDKKVYRAGPGAIAKGVPLVVLTDGGTASAAEIVAGALKDHGRATLVGEKTYGKASVQSIFPLGGSSNAAISLTTHHYYTPSGHDIHQNGIDPTHKVPQTDGKTDTALDVARGVIKERYSQKPHQLDRGGE